MRKRERERKRERNLKRCLSKYLDKFEAYFNQEEIQFFIDIYAFPFPVEIETKYTHGSLLHSRGSK
jgi:hypothetical protein